jgi:hypothetical protein
MCTIVHSIWLSSAFANGNNIFLSVAAATAARTSATRTSAAS